MMKHLVLPSLLFLAVLAPAQDKPAKPDKPAKDAPTKQETVDFEKQVWPILEKRCVECHATAQAGPDGKMKKPKGGVTLDSKTGITASKGGKVVIAKKSGDSMLVESISLPADHDDRMPPAKKGDPLTKEQIELITKWIDQGAEFGAWTGKAAAKDAGKDKTDKGGKDAPPAGGKPGDGKSADKDKKPKDKDHHLRLGAGLKPVAPDVLASFADGPFVVQGLGDGSPLLSVTCSGRTDEVDDAALAKLAPLAQHVTELDLGHSRVADDGCAVLATMPRLTTLDLRQTGVGNHGIAALAACKELRSLNLFGTKAGDYGIAALGGLQHLEHLYVWQTEVSAQALVRLRETLPEVRVVVAADLPEPMADAPAAARRRGAAK